VIVEEFKQSLKMPEVEELLDLFFYRPIAFLFVKAVYRWRITPNQITIVSGLFGLLAAWCFSRSTSFLAWGALFYAVANILDCSDGQLARLQGSGTQFGRIIDGMTDYVATIAIFIGLGIGFSGSGESRWLLVILAGISSAVHAFFFDRHQSEFMSVLRGEHHPPFREREQYEDHIRGVTVSRRSVLTASLLRLYVAYLKIQEQVYQTRRERSFDPDSYRKRNLRMIRFWSFLGPTTNRSLLIVCALSSRPDVYLWLIILAGNLWLIICLLYQRRIYGELLQEA